MNCPRTVIKLPLIFLKSYWKSSPLFTYSDVKVNEASAGGDLKETNDGQYVNYSAPVLLFMLILSLIDCEESTIDSPGSTDLKVDESFENG